MKAIFFKGMIAVVMQFIAVEISLGQIYSSSLDIKPPGWNGKVFRLSKDYPRALPEEKNHPWMQYDFKTQPKEYMNAVLQYFIEGNNEVDWVVQNNKVRKWYHAPSMAWQPPERPYGREFIHGLTRERNSPPRELWPDQKNIIQNWAVGFYNAIGAYTFGQVWEDTTDLKVNNVSFPEGTVSAKLLFTAADTSEVPYVKGSLEWQANIHTAMSGGTITRSPKAVRLLQIDIGIKDSRADDLTGWVFGTFAYHSNAKGKNVWEKLVPVGLMWGNDPGKFNEEPLEETWINPEFLSLFKFPNGQAMHVGYKGRLNGPVDNPISSCLSCHSTAQDPPFRPLTPNVNKPEDLAKFFRNVKSNEPFDGDQNSNSLDYSLQLSGGIAAAIANRPKETAAASLDQAKLVEIEYFITSMDDKAILAPYFEDDDVSDKNKSPSEESKFKWADYLKPSIDLLIALLGAFILVWRYLTQKQKESKERIIESKRNAYSEFLKDFSETAVKVMHNQETGGIEEDRKRIHARNLLLLFGNDKVVKSYNDWVEFAENDKANQGSERETEIFGKILIEIRKDIHGASKLSDQEIRNLNPFYRG